MLTVYICGLITPFILTIFYLRTSDTLALLLIEFLCFLIVTALTIYLFKSAKTKELKKYFPIITIFTIVIYLSIYTSLIKSADFVFLIQRQTKLEQIVASINKTADKESQIKEVLPELKKLGIQNVSLVDDQTLSFTIDCFIDNGSGIAFSRNSKQPIKGNLGCGGHLTRWDKLKKNWFAWSEN